MAADDRPGDPAHDGPAPGTSPRRARAQSQRDFELEFFGAVLERDPLYTAALRAHADNLAAKGLHARALQADRRLVRLLPDRPIPWYNLACTYAVLGMTDPALAALQRAVELDYPRPDRHTRDPDLRSLHGDPRFVRLLHRLRVLGRSSRRPRRD
jgi:tetratricopeptide (TPR) repeat protein